MAEMGTDLQSQALDVDEQIAQERQAQETAVGKVTDKRDTAITKAQTDIENIHQKYEAIKEPEPFDYRNIKPPHHELSRDFMIKASILMAVSIAGAAFMRQGSMVAMAGMSGALQGLMAGDTARYNREMDQYERTIKMMQSEYDRRWKHYQGIMKDESKSIQEKEHEIRLAHLSYGEDYKDAIRPYGEHIKELEAQKRMIQRMMLTIPKAGRDSRTAPQKEYDRMATQEASSAGISIDEWKKQPGNSYKEMFESGKLRAPSSSSKSSESPFKTKKSPEQWVAEVKKEHPDWTPQQIAAEAKKRAGAK